MGALDSQAIMATWSEFEAGAPSLAAAGGRLMYRNGDGEGLLVTVRGDDPPRAHPVNAGIVDGHLYTFVQANSAKRREVRGRVGLVLHGRRLVSSV